MSLIRRLWLLLAAVATLATAGSLLVSLVSTRDLLQTQLHMKNNDNAQLLAQALSQQAGDRDLMGLMLQAQFDTGFYRRLRLVASDGSVWFLREAVDTGNGAPAWFRELFPIDSPPGSAQVSAGWRSVGRIDVVSQSADAHEALWRSGARHAAWLVALSAVALVVAMASVRRLSRPLDAAVQQATALVEGRYVLVDEPDQPELRRVAEAMNAMVRRVRSLFEAQAVQVETLRRQTHCDVLTGLPHRDHFLSQLGAWLLREDGLGGGALVLVRVSPLALLNQTLGRETVDRALLVVAQVLQAYPARVSQCMVGRLNGADFALCLPTDGLAAETSESIAAALASSLPAVGSGLRAHVGAIEFRRGITLREVMSQADLALARAESRAPFSAEVLGGPQVPCWGEGEWRKRLASAIERGGIELAAFPVIDAHGGLVHLECPMRLQLQPDGPYEVAAMWLPQALRVRLATDADMLALRTALRLGAADGQPRALNLSTAALVDGAFLTHVRQLLIDRPQDAARLWVEWPEAAAIEHFGVLQDTAALLRPLGVKVGLEHCGVQLHRIERLFELGIDYIKLDASLCAGVSASDAARDVVQSTAALLRALSIQVMAEGVAQAADARVLFECGVDAVTGPWARGR